MELLNLLFIKGRKIAHGHDEDKSRFQVLNIIYEYVTVFGPHVLNFGLFYLYVTLNDISVIYATYGTYCRCAGGLKKKGGPTVGLQRHRHFVGSLTCPPKDKGPSFLR